MKIDKKDVASTKTEIETGMTAVELKGNIVSQLSPMNEEEKTFSRFAIQGYLDRSGNPKNIMLLSNELKYFTIFSSESDTDFAGEIFNFIDTDPFLKTIGDLKLIDADKDLDHVEVWIGNKFFALFDCDDFIIKI